MRIWQRARRVARLGGNDGGEARRLADLERAAGEAPRGCAWLDDRTVDDLDLAQVFGAIDRTRTATGAQVLWRWLAAPAHDLGLLAERERRIAALCDAAVCERAGAALGTTTVADAAMLPRLLWEPPATPLRGALLWALGGALVAFLVVARWWPPALLGVVAMVGVNLIVDDWSKLRLAQQARGLEVLDDTLKRAARLARVVPTELAAPELGVRDVLRRRMAILALRDPFDILDLVRAGLLVRLVVTRSAMQLVAAERERLREIVLWFGEVDALCAIAALRAERSETRIAELVRGAREIVARDLVHPAVVNAIDNDVELRGGLLVTGSNMSGKSTFLRTIAVNAVLAQSIHTTFGAWRATPLTVRTVMRIADDPARGMSTYAIEVAAIGELVAASDSDMLFVVDEPFNGTNPTIRVPIVVAVLEYLVEHGLVVAATHDLDVATRLNARFERGYFEEQDEGAFDRHLRAGIAPATNAVEILRRAGYPNEILRRLL
jgi:urease gamma subunit